MKFTRYSRWDGSQNEWTLDVERALDADPGLSHICQEHGRAPVALSAFNLRHDDREAGAVGPGDQPF